MRSLYCLFSVLLVACSSGSYAAENDQDKAPPYPVANELVPGFYISQFKRQFPNEEELRAVSPDDIVEKLVDKTLSVTTHSIQQSTNIDGIRVSQGYNSEWHLVYLAADGNARKFFGADDVRSGLWEISDNKLITLTFKSKDPDGANRIIIRSYPLARFIRAIRDSRYGDYCQLRGGSSSAIVINYGKVSHRLAEACARRKT